MSANPAIRVSSGLVSPEHVAAIGPALWTYLCLLDWQTSEDGRVFHRRQERGGGVRVSEISKRLGFSERTVREHLATLRPYLKIRRAQYGFFITIRNPKKHFRPEESRHSETGRKLPVSDSPDRKNSAARPEESRRSHYIPDEQGTCKPAGQPAFPMWHARLKELGVRDSVIEELFGSPWVNGHTDEELTQATQWKPHQTSDRLMISTIPESLARQKQSVPTATNDRDAQALRHLQQMRRDHDDDNRRGTS